MPSQPATRASVLRALKERVNALPGLIDALDFVEPEPAPQQRWLLTAVGESMIHEGSFDDATILAERSWAAQRTEPVEGALVWRRDEDGAWSLLHQEEDGALMPTRIKVRAR